MTPAWTTKPKNALPPVPIKDYNFAPVPTPRQTGSGFQLSTRLDTSPSTSRVENSEKPSSMKGKRARGLDSPDGGSTKRKRKSSPMAAPVNAIGQSKKVNVQLYHQ